MESLLSRRASEEERLQINPNNQITQARISKIDEEINELHGMIIEVEKNLLDKGEQ